MNADKDLKILSLEAEVAALKRDNLDMLKRLIGWREEADRLRLISRNVCELCEHKKDEPCPK